MVEEIFADWSKLHLLYHFNPVVKAISNSRKKVDFDYEALEHRVRCVVANRSCKKSQGAALNVEFLDPIDFDYNLVGACIVSARKDYKPCVVIQNGDKICACKEGIVSSKLRTMCGSKLSFGFDIKINVLSYQFNCKNQQCKCEQEYSCEIPLLLLWIVTATGQTRFRLTPIQGTQPFSSHVSYVTLVHHSWQCSACSMKMFH